MQEVYKLVVSEDIRALEIKVNRYIEHGFTPLGGLIANGCKLIQPMVKNYTARLKEIRGK